jgi:heme exporter protein C
MQRFANPRRFQHLAAAILPWLQIAALAALAYGLHLALFSSPADYQQGETVRIMYVHVPAAWMALGVYVGCAVAGALALVWRHPLAEIALKEMAPIGACFTFICLATGSLWGKPMWGTWWVWDARLTSVLVLFFLYLGLIALANAFDDEQRGVRATAILALVGVINVPIIKFSVDWWNTLHQSASVVKIGGPAIHPAMLTPLLVMALAYAVIFATILIWRMQAALAERRLAVRRMLASETRAS